MSEAESIGETMLLHGCTERQMEAMFAFLDSVEMSVASVNLNVVGLRALAHCGKLSERDADAVLWMFKELLAAVRKQRDSIAGLIGKRKQEA